ncbi:MAG: hypothetical protein EBR28_14605, partial [Planctomycetia bacterium]|nr:hypothetical protein [Planctomycetia bacterium]
MSVLPITREVRPVGRQGRGLLPHAAEHEQPAPRAEVGDPLAVAAHRLDLRRAAARHSWQDVKRSSRIEEAAFGDDLAQSARPARRKRLFIRRRDLRIEGLGEPEPLRALGEDHAGRVERDVGRRRHGLLPKHLRHGIIGGPGLGRVIDGDAPRACIGRPAVGGDLGCQHVERQRLPVAAPHDGADPRLRRSGIGQGREEACVFVRATAGAVAEDGRGIRGVAIGLHPHPVARHVAGQHVKGVAFRWNHHPRDRRPCVARTRFERESDGGIRLVSQVHDA